MEPLSIAALTIIAAAVAALVFLSGYETATRQLQARLQQQADRRVQGVLAELPKLKRVTKTLKRRRAAK